MKQKIMSLVKYLKPLYLLYYYLFSLFVNIIKLFVRTDSSLILFNSFGGKKFDDSPRAIYEAMRTDPRFSHFRFVWAFHQPDAMEVPGADIIKTDSLQYFLTALKARCWVTNSSIERGLNFIGKKTFYFNTWHGTPIKKMGADISSSNKSFKTKAKSKVDIMTAQGDFEAEIFSRVFNIPQERFLLCGLPRNDKLVHYTQNQRQAIREKLGIPKDKAVILYAPTFREYEKDSLQNCVLKPPMDLTKWQEALGHQYVLLFRAHYEVSNVMNIQDSDFLKNATSYPELSDLMIAADLLVSDYSSIFFDFSVMDKPMLHFTYDYDRYQANRGMYFDLREHLNGSDNEEQLIKFLSELNWNSEVVKTRSFREMFVNYAGSATSQSLDCIWEHINN